MLRVDVVFRQTVISIAVGEGSTIAHTISLSTILQQHPEIDLSQQSVGIYNKVMPLEQTVRDGDRIEIYQPLLLDPKDARRRRAGKRMRLASSYR